MWPWQRRVQVVLVSSAGDDATAALTMILRYHRKPVTIEEVRQAIYEESAGGVNAADVLNGAECFRLRGRGVAIDDRRWLARIPTPSIAHMMLDRGPFPRSLAEPRDGYFAVVTSISPRRIRWIDPYEGQIDDEPAEFLELASGIFLLFDEGHALPRARLRPGRSDG